MVTIPALGTTGVVGTSSGSSGGGTEQVPDETTPLLPLQQQQQQQRETDDPKKKDGDETEVKKKLILIDNSDSGGGRIALVPSLKSMLVAPAVLLAIGSCVFLLVDLFAGTSFSSSLSSSFLCYLGLRTANGEEPGGGGGLRPPGFFDESFVFGVATSSYQIEGAANEGGRGRTVWDDFCHAAGGSNIEDGTSGDVACDHYHRARDDVQLMAAGGLNVNSYRFSVAWSRILPNGTGSVPNPEGIAFYSGLIDALIENGIEPTLTMFHWDLPSALEEGGGWLSRGTVDAFEGYARILFREFGDRVRRWVTLNEPWTVAVNGYASGVHAPGHMSATEPYLAAHHLLLAHARAVDVYRNEFAPRRSDGKEVPPLGQIGIANSGDYRYPLDPTSASDQVAADRAMEFQFGWFVEPLVSGEYPRSMRERLGNDRLPQFTEEEKKLLVGSYDFLGLNYYSSKLASQQTEPRPFAGYWGADMNVKFTDDPQLRKNDMGWPVDPGGLRLMLKWIADRYCSPTLFVTENGSAESEPSLETALHDTGRRSYLEGHLRACGQSVALDGVDLRGYYAWSLMDNFEWQFGYTKRFGLYYVNFDTQERTPKSSAIFYNQTIAMNGRNLIPMDSMSGSEIAIDVLSKRDVEK